MRSFLATGAPLVFALSSVFCLAVGAVAFAVMK